MCVPALSSSLGHLHRSFNYLFFIFYFIFQDKIRQRRPSLILCVVLFPRGSLVLVRGIMNEKGPYNITHELKKECV